MGVYAFSKRKRKNRVLICVWLNEKTYKDFEKIAKKFNTSPNKLAKETVLALIDEYKRYVKALKSWNKCNEFEDNILYS